MMIPTDLTARRKRFFSQRRFAALVGVSPEHWNRLERSRFRGVKEASSIYKLADAILTYMELGPDAAVKVLMR